MYKKVSFICLLVLSLIPLGGLAHSGLPVTHDGQDHVARIANFYQNLQEGNGIPRWAPNLNWGYGHPILMFLYPLPSYTTSAIHFLGFSFVDSVKIFFALAFILSGLVMYIWLKEFLFKGGAFIGAMLYVFAPYRFIDLYVRGAIGEHAAFIFPPLVLYFLFKLSKKQSYLYILGGALSLAGLILAHNAISLMFIPVIILYATFLIWNSKKRKVLILNSLFLILFGFILSAFFWMPALMEGKYTLRDIVTQGSVNDRFVSFQQLLDGPWSYGGTGQFSVQVGLLHWFFIVVSIPLLFMLKKKRDRNWILLFASLLLFFFTLFLMTPYSQLLWEKVTTLQKFQFPWRFLSLSVFLSAVIGAIVIHESSGHKALKSSSQRLGILVLLIVAILFLNKDYWHAKDYLQKPESFYTGIYDSTTDTGESAPIWSVRFMEKRPSAHLEIIDGRAKIAEKERTSTLRRYSIDAASNVKLKENTLYFPGWKVLVDGKEVAVEFQNQNHRGLMTFFVDKGKHDVTTKFEETKLRLIADSISAVGLFLLVFFGILNLTSLRGGTTKQSTTRSPRPSGSR